MLRNKREGLLFFSQHLQRLLSRTGPMALNKLSIFNSYSPIGTMSHQTEDYFISRMLWIDSKRSDTPRRSDFPSFKGCLDKKGGLFKRNGDDRGKARALSQYCQFVQDKSIYTDTDIIKSHRSPNHGLPINGLPQHMFSEKLTVAVDVDEGILVLTCVKLFSPMQVKSHIFFF